MKCKILKILQDEIKAAESMSRVRYDTGLAYALVHKLANGGDCQVTTAQTLLDYFGYAVVKTSKRKTAAKQRPKSTAKRPANKTAKRRK